MECWMKILQYIRDIRDLHNSEYNSVQDMLTRINSLEFQLDQPIVLTKICKGEVINRATIGICDDRDPMYVTLDIGAQ